MAAQVVRQWGTGRRFSKKPFVAQAYMELRNASRNEISHDSFFGGFSGSLDFENPS